MYKFTYKKFGKKVTETFDKYSDLLRGVAKVESSRWYKERRDFVSLIQIDEGTGEEKIIAQGFSGIVDLANEMADTIDAIDAAEQDSDDDDDESDDEDGDDSDVDEDLDNQKNVPDHI